ncbi:MAG: PEP/pyruvate-binding domain-containing protein, partial [Vicingaceae bacterium]|nr:PEP/pyruvate-binding domain-containing protein [Vicingaceae bacterium]
MKIVLSKISLPIILFILVSLTNTSCTSAQPKPKFLNEITSITEFKMLSGSPISNKYGGVEAIKVVYDIKADRIYFLNRKNYKYHHGFCSYKLNYNKGLAHFNEHNYAANSEQRIYLLGNINYYKNQQKYIMDLSPADLIQIKEIEQLYHKIKSAVFFNKMELLLNTSRLINIANQFNIPTISPEEIYKGLNYQAIGLNTTYGTIKFATLNDLKTNNYSESDILVLEETPNIIPNIAGVITSEFQTPLSHLSILGRNRGIPIMAIKEAFKNKSLRNYHNKFVRFDVSKNDYSIKMVSKEKYGDMNLNKRSKVNLKRDLNIDTLVGFDKLNKVSAKSIGNKAKNFAVLQHLSKKGDFKVPESAFAIPFSFYDKHLESSGAGILIEQFLIDYKKKKDSVNVKNRLKEIRKTISKSTIDQKLVLAVNKKIKQLGNHKRFRFRSSTNAEDMKGFGGAGLYTSKTGIVNDSTKTIEKAIKKVWASLWNIQAFNERTYFNINQEKVAMGILVHRSFPNEIANGVAITKNIYRESQLGVIINVQVGNESVVDPKPGVICDQIICYEGGRNKIYTEKDIVEVITKSSLNNNILIMTDAEIIHLTKQLELVKKHYSFRNGNEYDNIALDIEFKYKDLIL